MYCVAYMAICCKYMRQDKCTESIYPHMIYHSFELAFISSQA